MNAYAQRKSRPDLHLPSTPAYTNLIRRAGSLLLHRKLDLVSLEGELPSSERIRIVAVDDGRMLPYLRRLASLENAQERFLGRVSPLWAVDPGVECDLLVVSANRLLHRRFIQAGFFVVPTWIRTFLTLPLRPEDLLKELGSSAKEDIRKVRTRGYSSEFTADPEWLERFYTDMYVPYAESRHGELAVVHSRRGVEREFRRGGLLVIRKGGEPITGLIIRREDELLRCSSMGVSDGDHSLAKGGGMAAFYWYAIEWAYANGCRAIDFGHSRAFLNDGVLRYKLKWGMQVLDDDDAVCDIALKPTPDSSAAQKFLQANPFFHLTRPVVNDPATELKHA